MLNVVPLSHIFFLKTIQFDNSAIEKQYQNIILTDFFDLYHMFWFGLQFLTQSI